MKLDINDKIYEINNYQLYTNPKNLKAKRFYKKRGYKVEKLIEDYYGPGEDRYLMVCEL